MRRTQKFCEITTLDVSCVVTVKSTVEISQNFVAFSKYMNFTNIGTNTSCFNLVSNLNNIITEGLMSQTIYISLGRCPQSQHKCYIIIVLGKTLSFDIFSLANSEKTALKLGNVRHLFDFAIFPFALPIDCSTRVSSRKKFEQTMTISPFVPVIHTWMKFGSLLH